MSGHKKKPTEQGALTCWRQHREEFVRTRKETDRARGTHQLETAEDGACQETERNRLSKAHSRPRNGRERYLSGHGKKPTERGALTSWRRQREGLVRTKKKPTDQGTLTFWRRQRERLVRTRKKIDRARRTHFLGTAERGTYQDTERKSPGEGYSPTGDDRRRDLSGHRKKQTERGTLTN